MRPETPRPEQVRRPPLALAAKLLLALGFGFLLWLLGSGSAQASERPVGPLRAVTHHDAVKAVTGTVRAVTGTTRGTVETVVRVESGARQERASRPRVERHAPRTERRHRTPRPRTIRFLPQADGSELLQLRLDPADRQLDVVAVPEVAGRPLPIRLRLPELTDALPSIDLTVGGPAVEVGHHLVTDRPTTSAVTATSGPAPASAAAVTERAAQPADRTPASHPGPRPQPADDRPEGPLPATAASPFAPVLAVLGSLGIRDRANGATFVHTARGRVPVAPAFAPPFSPD